MAIPLAPAVVALISVVGVGIFKVVEGDHDRAFFLDPSSPILCGCMEYSTNADTLATGLATGVSKAPSCSTTALPCTARSSGWSSGPTRIGHSPQCGTRA